MLHYNVKEYEEVRAELVRIQDCITEYMKMFYAAGAATVIVIWTLLKLALEKDLKFLDAEMLGYAVLFLSTIVIAFSSIIFHKLNTHNRYSGYARALGYETWDSPAFLTFDGAKIKVRMWEICLSKLYGLDFTKPPQADENETKKRAMAFLSVIDRAQQLPVLRSIGQFVTRGCVGLLMTVAAIVRRYPTRSWTYPYPISFGLFVVGLALMLAWLVTLVVSIRSGSTTYWIGAIVTLYLSLGWWGMFNRLYRLCADDGDRTIETYMYKFMFSREQALSALKIPYNWNNCPTAPRFDPNTLQCWRTARIIPT